MRIDGHAHISSIVMPENRIPEPEGGYAHQLIQLMDEAKFDKAVIMPIAPFDENIIIANAVSEFPDRLIGFASVDPNEANVFDRHVPVKKLVNDVNNYNLKGLKLNPRVQNFSLRDNRIIPIFQCAADLGIPVLIDGVSEISPVLFEENLPFAIDHIARAVPKVNIILAHMGGHRILDGYILAVSHPNIYLDLSAIHFMYKDSSVEMDIAFVLKNLGPIGKVIYGSDFPMLSPNKEPYPITVSSDYYEILFEDLDFTEQIRNNIMGNTMLSLLRI